MSGFNPFSPTNQNTFDNVLQSSVQNRGFFSRILKDLSTWGQKYDDMVVKNAIATNIWEDPSQQHSSNFAGKYDLFSRKATAMMVQKQPLAALDARYPDKLRVLREYSVKDEIRDYVSTLTDDCICYDEDKQFCTLSDLGQEFENSLKTKLQDVFEGIYNRFEFNNGIAGFNYFKDFLVDGYLAFEIVYDDKMKNIVGFNKLDPASLTYAIEPISGKKVWIQYAESQQYRKVLLDSQIIYIAYSSSADYNETSYVEPLIKPFNQLKLLQQTRIMFNLINATIHKKFVIPTNGMPRQRGEQEISTLIADYKDDVMWDDTTGIITIDGQAHPPFSKEYWFPKDENGSPEMEIVDPKGHDLNESDILTYFYNILKRASKIPFNRFDKDNGGGNIYFEGSDMTHDENSYNNFIGRLRAIFREILIKPIFIQMCLLYPELKDDENFRNKLNLKFFGNNQLEEWRRLNNLKARAEIASNLITNLQTADQKPYFHIEWIVREVMGLTEEEIAANKKWWATNPAEGAATGGSGAGGGELGGGGGLGGDLGDLGGEGGEENFGEEGGEGTQPAQGEEGTQNPQPNVSDEAAEEPTI